MPRLALALTLALAFVAGCKPAAEPGPELPRKVAKFVEPSGPMPEDEWLQGRLPRSVREGPPVPGGELTIRIHTEPPHLSPHVIDPPDAMATRLIQGRVYDTLMRIDPHDHPRYRLVPGAAESFEESSDHLTYTFRLRKGMKFHDGKPVTAHDVVATLARILEGGVHTTSSRSYYTDVREYRAVDELTFRIKLNRPYFLFFRQLSTTLPILPRHLLEKGPFDQNPIHRAPVGSGPWKFESWTPGQQIVLVRNEAFWGRRPHLDRLRFRIVSEHSVATQLFERGEFDLMTQIQHGVWVEMVDKPELIRDYNRIRFFPKNYEWVGWNAARPYFSDRRVRKAMALLFDRDTFNRNELFNLEQPTACHFYLESEDCDPSLVPLPYDPEGAREFLKQAGWQDHDDDGILDRDGVPFRFTLLIPSSSVFLSKVASVLRESYRKVGVSMDVSRVDWSTFRKRTQDRDFDACGLLWADSSVYSDPYQVWHSSQAAEGSNYVGFRNTRADELIERARVEFDPARRSALYRELGRILYQEQPYMWLNVRPDLDAARKNVRGLAPTPSFYNLEEIWLDRPASAGKASRGARSP